MIPFAVTKYALDMGNLSGPPAVAALRRFCQQWKRYGVLVLPRNDDLMREFIAAVDLLPQNIRKEWKVALKQLNSIRVDIDWCNTEFPQALQLCETSELCQLIAMDPQQTEYLGIECEDHSKRIGNGAVEIVRVDCADQADIFVELERWWEGGVLRRGISREMELDIYFGHIIKYANIVVLVDRYTICDAVRNGFRNSGLEHALELIGKNAISVKVEIIGGNKGIAFEEIETLVVGDIAKCLRQYSSSISGILVTIVEDRKMMELAHDRYMRAGNIVVDIGRGLEIFEGNSVRRQSTISRRCYDEQTRKTEQLLKRDSWSRQVEESAVY